ncbi:arginase family protein [Ochrobactrum sp. 19YEA23]|uniref:arginase family protein n=1 Tax=Ochrobactrum sp. 19YEA23 TaxID=3039854 RepID=UPI0024783F1B
MQIMRGLNGLNFNGSDVVEVAPQYNPATSTAQVAVQILFIQLCLVATAIQQRKLGSWAGQTGNPIRARYRPRDFIPRILARSDGFDGR